VSMPTQLSYVWDFLHREVLGLHGRWEIFEQLYVENSPQRIDLLNKTAPTFFALLQGILLDHVQLSLSKLADPAATGRHPNLTLETLVHDIEKLPDPGLAQRLRPLLANYRTSCATVINRRNKDIAHFDYATQMARAQQAMSLPSPSRQEIHSAFITLREFMRSVYVHFEEKHMAYEGFSCMTVPTSFCCFSSKGFVTTSLWDRERSAVLTSASGRTSGLNEHRLRDEAACRGPDARQCQSMSVLACLPAYRYRPDGVFCP
jgi:hypothetical protein